MRSPAFNGFVPNALVRDETADYRAPVIALLLLLSLPFIQFGLSYWISVQGLAFCLVAMFVDKRLNRLQLFLFTVIAVAMLLSLAGHLYSDSLFYAFIRIVRQIIAMYLIVCAAATSSWRPKPFFFDVMLPIVVVGVCGLVLLQFATYTLFGWSYLFIPAQAFIQGFSTLANSWIEYGAARGFLADVRAAGTFAEPSYFGFIALSLGMLVLRGVESSGRMWLLISLLFAALLCTKSASGVVLFALMVLFAIRAHLGILHWIGIVAVVGLSLVLADVALNFPLFERIINITDPVLEPSGYTRLILPLKHIALVLQQKPLGVPLSEFFMFTSRNIDAYGSVGSGSPISLVNGISNGTDNGFFNLFMSFGIGGFLIVGLLPFIVRDKLLLLFLLFVSQFNGDIFSPDKAAVVALVLSCRRVVAADTDRASAAKRPRFSPPGPFGSMLPMRA